MKPSEIIRESKCILFEQGWAQHTLSDSSGAVCAFGAINQAAHGSPRYGLRADERFSAAMGVATNALRKAIRTRDIPIWNNAPETTFDEVVEAFDRAEKIAEQAECDALLREEGAK